MDATARSAAELLIDFYAGFAASDDESEQARAFETSLRRLNEGDVVAATQSDDGNLTLDFTPLLLATGVSFQWLIDQLAAATGKDSEELVFDLREFIAGLEDD